jgi:hypothetical protein
MMTRPGWKLTELSHISNQSGLSCVPNKAKIRIPGELQADPVTEKRGAAFSASKSSIFLIPFF